MPPTPDYGVITFEDGPLKGQVRKNSDGWPPPPVLAFFILGAMDENGEFPCLLTSLANIDLGAPRPDGAQEFFYALQSAEAGVGTYKLGKAPSADVEGMGEPPPFVEQEPNPMPEPERIEDESEPED
jgi:hypothetical protein